MRRANRSGGAILTLVCAVAATGLLGSTLVLGLLGTHSPVMWTGTMGCLFLAGWLLAATGRIRRRSTGGRKRPHGLPPTWRRKRGEPT